LNKRAVKARGKILKFAYENSSGYKIVVAIPIEVIKRRDGMTWGAIASTIRAGHLWVLRDLVVVDLFVSSDFASA